MVKAQDEQTTDSVFDFLYHDSRRIGSFLSQFDNNGLLTGLSHSEGVTKGAKRSKKVGIGGSSPVGGGSFEFEIGPGETGSENLERAYDPFWANARTFLDLLSERDMLCRNAEGARIGQFVLVSGSLIIADLKMVQKLWELPAVRNMMIAGALGGEDEEDISHLSRQERRKVESERKRNKGKKQEIPDELAITMEMLPYMPHSGQMHIVTDNDAFWAPITDNCMVSPISELMLKHGSKIAGTWNMVGILDALPFEEHSLMNPLEMLRVGMMGDNLTNVALSLGEPIMQTMGRPLLSYGITPLLVFREIES